MANMARNNIKNIYTNTNNNKYKLNVLSNIALKSMALKLFKIILGNFIKIVKLMS
jgi:hypothetical protein